MGNMFGLTSDEKKSNDEATAPNVSPVVPVSQIGGYRSRKNKTRTRRKY
jgi:hypothetical protein